MNAPQRFTGETTRHALPRDLIHDLRTPLNQIIGYSAMLLEQAQEQGQDGFLRDLQKTQTAGQELLTLINDHFHSIGTTDARAGIAPQLPKDPALSDDEFPEDAAAGAIGRSVAQGAILVVDDIEANRDVLSRRLERQGYTISTAENGREALDKVQATKFDLLLLDLMMPEMDGYEVLQRLKANETLRHIPVIMISAVDELDSVVRCIELGAEDYLSKPFNPTLLKARIGACLEKKRARDRETQDHQRLQELAAALHMQNSEMARWRKMHEADLAVARSTQQGIIASALPRPDGWQVDAVYTPLIQVGGDVYGWRVLDNGAWLFWLADATGHGVAAALLTALVAWLFEHASASCNTAHGILAYVNKEFCKVLRGNAFMTACCAVIDRDGRLSYAGAGHPPLLIRRSNGVVEALPSGNTIMGYNTKIEMSEVATTLAFGDVALLYTDGLHGLRDSSGAHLTHNAIADALSPIDASPGMLPRLITQLVERSGTQAFEDDLAAIALYRE